MDSMPVLIKLDTTALQAYSSCNFRGATIQLAGAGEAGIFI